jgi:ribosome biogenesis GTPase
LGRTFWVVPEEKSEINPDFAVECVTAGAMVSSYDSTTTIAAVGDYVLFAYEGSDRDSGFAKGVILKIEERKTILSRKAINYDREDVISSNIEYCIIFVSAAEPEYNKRLIDRILVAAELGRVQSIICINKIDLSNKDEILEDLKIYKYLDIDLFPLCSITGEGLQPFLEFIKGKDAVLCGQSGSGKSTFINLLFQKELQKVREISRKTSKGKHTTSYIRMFRMENGGSIIDTPGIREFGVWDIDRLNLFGCFHDFDPYIQECKYLPCTHTHEPDCAVIRAVEDGLIDLDRYESYLNIFYSLEK